MTSKIKSETFAYKKCFLLKDYDCLCKTHYGHYYNWLEIGWWFYFVVARLLTLAVCQQ